jgi:hypothetical protein
VLNDSEREVETTFAQQPEAETIPPFEPGRWWQIVVVAGEHLRWVVTGIGAMLLVRHKAVALRVETLEHPIEDQRLATGGRRYLV